jgi:hypothetical protein
VNVKNLSTLLWFLAGWSGAGLLVGYMGLPTGWALAAGLVTAAAVRWDPTGILWNRPASTRRLRPIEDVAAELSGQGAGASAGERSRI